MKRKNNQSGLTLIEVLVVGALSVLLGIVVVGLYLVLNKNQSLIFDDYLDVNTANNSVASLTREIRTARSADTGAYLLERANDQEIVFYSDSDYDGEAEKIRYFLDGTNFSKGVTEATEYPISYPPEDEFVKVLSTNVRNGTDPVFYYYNEDWPEDTTNNPLPSPRSLSNITFVKVVIILNTVENNPEGDYVLESDAQIRVVKENL